VKRLYGFLDERFDTETAAIEFMLMEIDESTGLGLPNKYILRCIRSSFQRSRASLARIGVVTSQMRGRGIKVPRRPKGMKKGGDPWRRIKNRLTD
jgi:hypothetical protein